MSELMAQADIAIGAGGSTAWERASLGLPSIAVILADNQRGLARGLEQQGALIAVENGDWSATISALRDLAADSELWHKMSKTAALVCDGLGAFRVALELESPCSRRGLPVRLRPAKREDESLILAWQTTPGARTYSSNPTPPTPEAHSSWMAAKLANPKCIFNIIEEAAIPVGVLRMDQRKDGSFMVSILIADAMRGLGIGLAALHAGAALLHGQVLWAKIDGRNTASLKLFAGAGFVQHEANLYCRLPVP